MIEHMNDDHVQAVIDYCSIAGIKTGIEAHIDTLIPKMTEVGCDGFLLAVGNTRIKFEFEQNYATPLEVRKALVALAKKARA